MLLDYCGYGMEGWMGSKLFAMMQKTLSAGQQLDELKKDCAYRRKKYFKYLAVPNILIWAGVISMSLSVFSLDNVILLSILSLIGSIAALIGFISVIVGTYKYMKLDKIEDSTHETGNIIYTSTYDPYTDSITTKGKKEYAGGFEWLKIGAAIYFVGVIYFFIRANSDSISLKNAKEYLANN